MNYIAILVAALIPNVVGFFWYNKKTFGRIWAAETGQTMDTENTKVNLIKLMLLSLFFSLLIAMAVNPMVIHQMGLTSLLANDPENMKAISSGGIVDVTLNGRAMNVMNNFRTFKHGAFHGILYGIFLILPIVAIGAMFENRSWKYSLITAGYWIVNLALMGGIICAWK